MIGTRRRSKPAPASLRPGFGAAPSAVSESARAWSSEGHKRRIVPDGRPRLPRCRQLQDRLKSRARFRDKSTDMFERRGSRDQISLQVDIAAIRGKLNLGRTLNTLGGYGQPELLAQPRNRLRDRRGLRIRVHVIHQSSIELDSRKRQLAD